MISLYVHEAPSKGWWSPKPLRLPSVQWPPTLAAPGRFTRKQAKGRTWPATNLGTDFKGKTLGISWQTHEFNREIWW